jgi:6-phosphogluconolactonase (cycloisomerase 2 family)
MKSISASNLVIPCLLLIALLAGCASVSSSVAPTPTPTASPTPTPVSTPSPSPTPTPSPTPAAHGTFVFVNSAATGALTTDEYRLDSDGTLTLVPGSPFPIAGLLVSSGRFLVTVDGSGVTSYKLNPATGVPQKAGASATTETPAAIAADAQSVYVAGVAFNNSLIWGYHISASGAFTTIPNSSFFFSEVCGGCPVPNSLGLNKRFLAVGAVEDPNGGDFGQFDVFSRASDGSLSLSGVQDGVEEGSVAVQHPAGNVGFAIDSNLGSINSYLVDAKGGLTAGTSMSPGAAPFIDELVDATGKFLLSVDSSGVVHVFSINSATAGFSQIGTSEPAGNGADRIAMDPSGHFLVLVQSSTVGNTPGTDQITVFTFDPASGAIQKLQSYPVGKSSSRIAILTL